MAKIFGQLCLHSIFVTGFENKPLNDKKLRFILKAKAFIYKIQLDLLLKQYY